MARMISVSGDEKVSRKLSRSGEKINLINHSVKANKDADAMLVFDLITLEYPGCDSAPTWLLERAAKADWVTIQRKLRELTQAEREAFDGKTLDVTALERYFEMKRTREPFEARLRSLAAGTLTREDFEATLTKAEQGQWDAMKALLPQS